MRLSPVTYAFSILRSFSHAYRVDFFTESSGRQPASLTQQPNGPHGGTLPLEHVAMPMTSYSELDIDVRDSMSHDQYD